MGAGYRRWPEKMQGAVLVAIVAAIGNFLQGWDNATIAGKTGIKCSFCPS